MLVLDSLDLQLSLLQKIKMPENNNLLVIVAIVAVCVALINLSITVNKIGDVKEFTGYATDTATANVTIITAASVLFTTTIIDWGAGRVNETPTFAFMDSEGNVEDGNWTPVFQGLTLQNDGNCNVTLNLTTSNDADGFIGGSASTNSYRLKLSDNESGSCPTDDNSLTTYTEATGATQDACGNFSYASGSNVIDIDVNISIPEDATSGAKGDVITATANCI